MRAINAINEQLSKVTTVGQLNSGHIISQEYPDLFLVEKLTNKNEFDTLNEMAEKNDYRKKLVSLIYIK